MNADQIKAFEEFWRGISRNEDFVRQYGHVGWHPGHSDQWDERLEGAYEAIHPHLRPLINPRIYLPPAEARGFRPFSAETAHQALMFLLNPPENLLGQTWILTSPEYLRVKREAQSELAIVQGDDPGTTITTPEAGEATPPQPRSSPTVKQKGHPTHGKTRQPSKKRKLTRAVLLMTILDHHKQNPGAKPLKQRELAKQVGFSQKIISTHMKEQFPGGWKGYLRCFGGELPKGHYDSADRAISRLEAIANDEVDQIEESLDAD